MDGKPRITGPEMLDSAEVLDPKLVELSDELMGKIAGGGEDWELVHKLCPSCHQSYVALFKVDGKPSYVYCPNCEFRFDY
ncbi:MAG: hypothetical protein IJ092_06865 [Atopobiaceae bacterium]|nr:hypothetical protein [Atopobiaceae bacterium]MBR1828407.1 hypothetical protein [Atopobiaceae bacterium]